jgi:hypothetical protein
VNGLWDFTKMGGMVRKLQKVVAEGGFQLTSFHASFWPGTGHEESARFTTFITK